ncbi:hypothetical protein ACTA71_003718 [Dictyostelium dimigraforme]
MDNTDIDIVFFKCWRNIVINREIFYYVSFYRYQIECCVEGVKELEGLDLQVKKKITNLTFMGYEMINHFSSFKDYSSLKRIKFTNNSMASISGSVFPDTLEEIIYPWSNNNINTNLSKLPKSVTSVKNVFNKFSKNPEYLAINQFKPTQPQKLSIPNSIKSISFSKFSKFNQTLLSTTSQNNNNTNNSNDDDDDYHDGNDDKIIIPNSITSIDLGINFMNGGKILKVGSLPNSIKILDLGYYNLELLENVIPDSVTYLKVYHPNKCQLLLPKNSIKSLLLRYNSMKPDNGLSINVNSIPPSVTKLDLETGVFPIDPNSIPSSVTNLQFKENFNIPITKSLLQSCKDSLKTIKIPNSSNLIIENDSLNQCSNLKSLEFYEKVNLGYFNRNEVGWNKSNLPLNFFPISLTSLSLGNGFNQLLEPGLLPKSLLYLYLGTSFNKPLLLNSLPSGLIVLKFDQDSRFNHSIGVGILPSTLITLEFGSGFSFKIIDPNILPKSLLYLVLPSEKFSISKSAIPKSIKDLRYLYF